MDSGPPGPPEREIDEVRREYHEARDSVTEIKDSTLKAGNEAAYWGTFILALMAQLKLASLLAGRRKKKEQENTKESILGLKAKKEVLEAQTKLAQMEAKAAALQAQLEKARTISPTQLNQANQLEAESAELLDSLAPELEVANSQVPAS